MPSLRQVKGFVRRYKYVLKGLTFHDFYKQPEIRYELPEKEDKEF